MYHPFVFALQFDTVRHLQPEQTSQMISERTDLLQGTFFDAKYLMQKCLINMNSDILSHGLTLQLISRLRFYIYCKYQVLAQIWDHDERTETFFSRNHDIIPGVANGFYSRFCCKFFRAPVSNETKFVLYGRTVIEKRIE